MLNTTTNRTLSARNFRLNLGTRSNDQATQAHALHVVFNARLRRSDRTRMHAGMPGSITGSKSRACAFPGVSAVADWSTQPHTKRSQYRSQSWVGRPSRPSGAPLGRGDCPSR